METLSAIDLFSGCGGLTLGLKQAGFRVIGAVEREPLASSAYAANHPDVAVWRRDIRSLPAARMMRDLGLRRGQLALMAGCPPCQGFSAMRTLNGRVRISDKRNDLIGDFLRFVKCFRPRAVMLENVPGLAGDGRFASFCRCLARMGYEVDHRILNACDYGVPQRRRRLILLAGHGVRLDFADPSDSRPTVAQAIAGLDRPGSSGDAAHDVRENRSERIRRLISLIPKDGGSRTDLPESEQLGCHRRCDGFKDVYGRMAWESLAPTITGGCFNPSKGRFLHPEQDRAITLREAALLQSFPADYEFPESLRNKSAVALMIGNALPPEFVRRHAEQVRLSLAMNG